MRTFVVRLWSSALPEKGRYALRGVVEEIETGRRSIFHDPQELLEHLCPLNGEGGEHDQEPTQAARAPAR